MFWLWHSGTDTPDPDTNTNCAALCGEYDPIGHWIPVTCYFDVVHLFCCNQIGYNHSHLYTSTTTVNIPIPSVNISTTHDV